MRPLPFLKTRPLYLVLSISLLVGYTFWSFLSFYYDTREFNKEIRFRFRQHLVNYSQTGKYLLEANNLDELTDRLEEANIAHEVDAYVIKVDGKVYAGIDRARQISQIKVAEPGVVYVNDDFTYARTVVGNKELTILVRYSIRDRMYAVTEHALPQLLRDLAIIFLISAWIATYFLRDLTQTLQALTTRRAQRKHLDFTARSTEGEILLKGLHAIDASMDELQDQNDKLRNQVLPALRSELGSGKKPPYEFNCTLVRVDVNNFSYIFNHYPVEEFMGVINGFFQTVTHIVSRYGGYIYEFVGDEVIFYFKDEEQQNSAQAALAALRDISDAAEALDDQVRPQKGYHFRIKCSASHGKLRFGPQVAGYSLAGAVLIDTVRILSLVHDKEKNSILYDEFVFKNTKPLVESQPHVEAILKGSSKSQLIYSYVAHEKLETLLNAPWSESRPGTFLNLYRDDKHILLLLEKLGSEACGSEEFLAIVRRLRAFKIHHSSEKIAAAYLDLMTKLSELCKAPQVIDSNYYKLSAIISVGMHILDKAVFETKLKPAYMDCLSIKDRRVVANVLDVFSCFDPDSEEILLRDLMQSKDNRVAANALFREGMRGLSKAVIKQTQKMLGSKDPLFKASALYVVGQLAAHHRSHNPIYLETHMGFARLIDQIEPLIAHPSEMVRRQALTAAAKTKDERLEKSIQNYYQGLADQERKLEIEILYLHSNDKQRSQAA